MTMAERGEKGGALGIESLPRYGVCAIAQVSMLGRVDEDWAGTRRVCHLETMCQAWATTVSACSLLLCLQQRPLLISHVAQPLRLVAGSCLLLGGMPSLCSGSWWLCRQQLPWQLLAAVCDAAGKGKSADKLCGVLGICVLFFRVAETGLLAAFSE